MVAAPHMHATHDGTHTIENTRMQSPTHRGHTPTWCRCYTSCSDQAQWTPTCTWVRRHASFSSTQLVTLISCPAEAAKYIMRAWLQRHFLCSRATLIQSLARSHTRSHKRTCTHVHSAMAVAETMVKYLLPSGYDILTIDEFCEQFAEYFLITFILYFS